MNIAAGTYGLRGSSAVDDLNVSVPRLFRDVPIVMLVPSVSFFIDPIQLVKGLRGGIDVGLSLVGKAIKQCHGVLDRHTRHDRFRRRHDVPTAVRHYVKASLYLIADLPRRTEGQRLLRADAADETQVLAELLLQFEDVHRLRLNGLEDVCADINEVGYDLHDIPARMNVNTLSALSDALENAGDSGPYETPPGLRANQQTPLRPVILAYADRVDPVPIVSEEPM